MSAANTTTTSTNKKPQIQQIFTCCESDDLEGLEEILQDGPGPGASVNSKGQSALHVCVLHGSLKCAEKLLTLSETDINKTDHDGATPLHYCAQSKKNAAELCEMLISHNARIDVQKRTDSLLPVHSIVMTGRTNVLSVLLSKSEEQRKTVDAICCTKHGRTSLHWSSVYGYADCVEVLLSYGASASLCTADQETPLELAVRNKKWNVAYTLATKTPRLAPDFLERLFSVKTIDCWKVGQVTSHHDLRFIDIILDRCKQTYGQSPPHVASSGAPGVVPAPPPPGTLPPQIAESVANGTAEVIFHLAAGEKHPTISLYGDMSQVRIPVDRLLILACMFNLHAIAKKLITGFGANVNQPSSTPHENFLICPLHVASEYGSAQCVELLIRHGAKVNPEKDKDLLGLYHYTMRQTPLHFACLHDKAACVEILIRHGADVNARNYRGETALHLVKSDKVLQLLVRAGANLHAKDFDGNTALHTASSLAVVQQLVAMGLSPCSLNAQEFLPIQNHVHELNEEGLATFLQIGPRQDLPGILAPNGRNLLHLALTSPKLSGFANVVVVTTQQQQQPPTQSQPTQSTQSTASTSQINQQPAAAAVNGVNGGTANAANGTTAQQTTVLKADTEEGKKLQSVLHRIALKLLLSGVDVNQKCQMYVDGRKQSRVSPLDLALSLQCVPVISALLDYGASLDELIVAAFESSVPRESIEAEEWERLVSRVKVVYSDSVMMELIHEEEVQKKQKSARKKASKAKAALKPPAAAAVSALPPTATTSGSTTIKPKHAKSPSLHSADANSENGDAAALESRNTSRSSSPASSVVHAMNSLAVGAGSNPTSKKKNQQKKGEIAMDPFDASNNTDKRQSVSSSPTGNRSSASSPLPSSPTLEPTTTSTLLSVDNSQPPAAGGSSKPMNQKQRTAAKRAAREAALAAAAAAAQQEELERREREQQEQREREEREEVFVEPSLAPTIQATLPPPPQIIMPPPPQPPPAELDSLLQLLTSHPSPSSTPPPPPQHHQQATTPLFARTTTTTTAADSFLPFEQAQHPFGQLSKSPVAVAPKQQTGPYMFGPWQGSPFLDKGGAGDIPSTSSVTPPPPPQPQQPQPQPPVAAAFLNSFSAFSAVAYENSESLFASMPFSSASKPPAATSTPSPQPPQPSASTTSSTLQHPLFRSTSPFQNVHLPSPPLSASPPRGMNIALPPPPPPPPPGGQAIVTMRLQDLVEPFSCPLTREIMHDPWTCEDGFTYERGAIEQWLQRSKTSPVTGAELRSTMLFPNVVLRNMIQSFHAMLAQGEQRPPQQQQQPQQPSAQKGGSDTSKNIL